jgi:uncharacterized protein
MLFVDTSAFYAGLDRADHEHSRARKIWERVLQEDIPAVTTNYVVVETSALVQSRLGTDALRSLYDDILPLLRIEWIDEARHASGVAVLLATSRRKLSLVDCVSFALMRELGIRDAFCFDRHFGEQGFHCIP